MRNEAQHALLDDGAAPGGRRRVDPAAVQLPATAQSLRESDAGDGSVPHARTSGTPFRSTRRSPGGRRRSADGPPPRSLTGAKRRIDTAVRRAIAEGLGHARLGVARCT